MDRRVPQSTGGISPIHTVVWVFVLLLILFFAPPTLLHGQTLGGEGVVSVARGQSSLLTLPVAVQRVSIGDPNIADAVVVSPREVLVNGRALGTTTLILWDAAGGRRTYPIEVTVDATALERTLQALFPGERMRVTASGNMVILSGTVTEARVGRQALEMARGTGAQVIDNLQVPPAQQILLQVRIAEVSRNVIREMHTQLRALNPDDVGTGPDPWGFESVSEGLLRLFIGNPFDPFFGQQGIEAIFRAFRTTGEVRTLAEPNLVALEGSEASFLAGGQFPFPILQSGGQGNAVTIQWREFGVRLNFVPHITAAGNIRLRVAPEVSSLDFGGGLVISGFAIPTLLMRRAETEVELREGQTFAIAGLLDNNTLESVNRLPLLGDIPIIGELFRSRQRRQNRTELLVLVTPRLVRPAETAPAVPTGEPETWRWDRHLRRPPGVQPQQQP